MKKLISIFILSFLFSSLISAQEKTYLLKQDANFKLIKSKDGKTILQSYLYLKNGFDFDVYYFIINEIDFEKPIEITKEKNNINFIIIDEDFLKKMTPCDLHEFFSTNKNIYLVSEKENKYYGINLFYQSTSKNTIISIQTTRI